MSKGTTPAICKCSGVLAPTQDASSQCAFASPLVTLLYFRSAATAALHRHAQCFELLVEKPTGDVDRCGMLERGFCFARMRSSKSGFFARNTRMSCFPFLSLQGSHARVRLQTRSSRDLLRGLMCSTSNGTLVFPQSAQCRPHFSSKYSSPPLFCQSSIFARPGCTGSKGCLTFHEGIS